MEPTVLPDASARHSADNIDIKAAAAKWATATLMFPALPTAGVIPNPFPCRDSGVVWPTGVFWDNPGVTDLTGTSYPTEVAQTEYARHGHFPPLCSFSCGHIIVNSHIPHSFH